SANPDCPWPIAQENDTNGGHSTVVSSVPRLYVLALACKKIDPKIGIPDLIWRPAGVDDSRCVLECNMAMTAFVQISVSSTSTATIHCHLAHQFLQSPCLRECYTNLRQDSP